MPALLNPRNPSAALLMALLLLGPAAAIQSQNRDRQEGVLRIMVKGKEIGRERFRISREDGHIEATAEIEIQGQGGSIRQTASMTLSRDGEPSSYRWRMQKPKAVTIKVNFEEGSAIVDFPAEGGGRDRQEFHFNTGRVAILDNNVFHHYALLAYLYDFEAGGIQSFPVLIPQSVQPGKLTVEDLGVESVTVGDRTILARRLRVITTDNRIRLWLGENRELLRLEVPGAGVTVEPE